MKENKLAELSMEFSADIIILVKHLKSNHESIISNQIGRSGTSIGDNYFHYVANTENVYFYKIYKNEKLIGTIHLEKHENLLYMDILIFPEFQKMGFATKVIKDIQKDIFKLNYKKIEISIDERNIASITLFENAGFSFVSKEDELMNFVYQKTNGL